MTTNDRIASHALNPEPQAELKPEPQIDRRCALSHAEFVNEYLKPALPVVIVDAIQHWTGLTKWTPSFLSERLGDRSVSLDSEQCLLRDFLDRIESPRAEAPAPHLAKQAVHELFPELLCDIEPGHIYASPNWLSGRFYPTQLSTLLNRCCAPEIEISGYCASFPSLSRDALNANAYISQIYGRGEYILSAVDQIPRSFARTVSVKLDAGETLFIPGGWWHASRSVAASTTVSINHANASNWSQVVRALKGRVRQPESAVTRLTAPAFSFYLSGVGLLKSLVSF
jgi:hypothetical protein